jgi:YHS domain-containing protein
MKYLTIILFATIFSTFSCKQKQVTHNALQDAQAATQTTTIENFYKDLKFAVNKDLVCGMPLSAEIGDTAYYKNKLYGFCSKECKDSFLKNPEAAIKAVK